MITSGLDLRLNAESVIRELENKFLTLIRMASRVAVAVFLLLILVLSVIILAYNLNIVTYSITDASGAKINATRVNTQDDKKPHHTWRDNRVHGDQYHRNLW